MLRRLNNEIQRVQRMAKFPFYLEGMLCPLVFLELVFSHLQVSADSEPSHDHCDHWVFHDHHNKRTHHHHHMEAVILTITPHLVSSEHLLILLNICLSVCHIPFLFIPFLSVFILLCCEHQEGRSLSFTIVGLDADILNISERKVKSGRRKDGRKEGRKEEI